MHSTINAQIDCRFASLGAPERVFAIPSIHGDLQKIHSIHETLFHQFRAGDRLVYLGNYTGYGQFSKQTIDSILSFRRFILSIPGVLPSDIVYLRGTQEEMWQKLIQLQFAPNPTQVLEWMLSQGLSQTMESYGIDINEATRVAREGVIRLSRWTENTRQTVYKNAGHDVFGSQLRRAAFTDCALKTTGTCAPLLFVNAGIDYTKNLDDQGDQFWWGNANFKSMTMPYSPFQRVVRGFDPDLGGYHENQVTATLDNNCGRGGNLVCAAFSGDGEIIDVIEAA
jgi:serine/threonine protein phosphatase 1